MDDAKRSSGFTLIEVALAVAIMGVALTTLIALQGSYLRSYQYERNLVRAALIGQYMLAIWEADANLPQPGESNRPLLPVLQKLGYFEENELMSAQRADLEGWMLRRRITKIGIPPVDDALRKIEVEVVWGPGQNELFQIVYFVKGIRLPGSEDDQAGDTADSGEEATPEDETSGDEEF